MSCIVHHVHRMSSKTKNKNRLISGRKPLSHSLNSHWTWRSLCYPLFQPVELFYSNNGTDSDMLSLSLFRRLLLLRHTHALSRAARTHKLNFELGYLGIYFPTTIDEVSEPQKCRYWEQCLCNMYTTPWQIQTYFWQRRVATVRFVIPHCTCPVSRLLLASVLYRSMHSRHFPVFRT